MFCLSSIVFAYEANDQNIRNDQHQDQNRQDQGKQSQEQYRQEQQHQSQGNQEETRQQQQNQGKQNQDQYRQDQNRQQSNQQTQYHDWSHPTYQGSNWHRSYLTSDEPFAFKWHEGRNSQEALFNAAYYRMEAIDDQDWYDRFPGLHPYRWHDNGYYPQGFWYHGHQIYDAVVFFDDSDQLACVGFMYEGSFMTVRDNQEVYTYDDDSFISIVINLFQN
jgi:hypothetical protein